MVNHVAGSAVLGSHVAQAVAVGAAGAAHHDHHIHLRAQDLDGVLSVLGGVANVLLFRFAHLRKALFHSRHDLCGVIHTEGGLRHHGQQAGLPRIDLPHVICVFHQMDAVGELPHGAFHLGVPFVADHDEFIAFFVQLGDFHMHLGDQRTGGIKDAKTPAHCFVLDFFGNSVGAEDQGCTFWHIVQVFYEDGSTRTQVVDHMGVVHNLVAHINGRTKFGQSVLDDVDSAVNAGTKASRLGQQNFLQISHSQHPYHLDFQTDGLPRQWMVEIKQNRILAYLHDCTCVLAFVVRCGKLHHLAQQVGSICVAKG